MGLLDESRIAIPLIPERLIAEAAQEHGLDLAAIEHADGDATTVVGLDPGVRVVLADAFRSMLRLVPQWVRIPFSMQHQQQTQWCWSAATVSVAHYYNSTSYWTQCELVNREFNQTTCCTAGSSSQCNQPHALDAPLRRVGALDRGANGSASYATVRGEVDGGRPLVIVIGWAGGGAHAIAIGGYRAWGGEWVAIGDPWYGDSDVALSSLTGGTYQGVGTWIWTYFTRRPILLHVPHDRIFFFPRRIWEQIRFEHGELAKGGTR